MNDTKTAKKPTLATLDTAQRKETRLKARLDLLVITGTSLERKIEDLTDKLNSAKQQLTALGYDELEREHRAAKDDVSRLAKELGVAQ